MALVDSVSIMDSEEYAKIDLETRKPTTYALWEYPSKFLYLKRKSVSVYRCPPFVSQRLQQKILR